MGLRFTVLASGSGGNASLLETDGFAVLLDVGLGPRQLASRLAAVGVAWPRIRAVLLTHTHTDHWKDRTLDLLRHHAIPLYCHADHGTNLAAWGSAFTGLRAAGLVHTYEADRDLLLAPGLTCRPLSVRHDSGPTFGFRIEAARDLFGAPAALGYLSDLGSWTPELAAAVLDADALAVEFNHDVGLEYASGRSPQLIARVLGEEGHLSNDQAAALLREVLLRSAPGRLRHVVQLHLSRQCNRPRLAIAAARHVLDALDCDAELHTASQDRPGPTLTLGVARPRRRPTPARAARRPPVTQGWFPEFGDCA